MGQDLRLLIINAVNLYYKHEYLLNCIMQMQITGIFKFKYLLYYVLEYFPSLEFANKSLPFLG